VIDRRTRRLLAPLVSCALALAADPVAAAPFDPAPLLLRLADIGPGYRFNYTATPGRCRRVQLSGELGREFPHRGCELFFERMWTPPGVRPGPRYADSLVFTFDDPEGPQAALARPRRTMSRVFRGLPPDAFELADVAPTIGDDTVLLRARVIFGVFEALSSTVVVWRSGRVLGVVAAYRRTDGTTGTDPSARRLARLQQGRIASPTPLRSSDNDDTEVALDNPRLGIPIWWLGRRLAGKDGRPAISLQRNDYIIPGRGTPRVTLTYGTPSGATWVELSLWKPNALRRQMRLERSCRRRYESGLDGIRAGIVGAYEPPQARCPRRPPDRYDGFAFLPGVAVSIEAGTCPNCRPKARGSFNSIAAVRTLLRALRPR